jgi:hypothetical protein
MLPQALALALALPSLVAAARPKNAILLSEVQSLTLRGNGAKTAHRRVSAIPQLKCISHQAICNLFEIDVMRCSNQGSSYGGEDIEWSCSASLPEEFKLGSTDVICEGYSSPNDPYVLKGSCGVEYRLALTDKGEQRYPDAARGSWYDGGSSGSGDKSGYLFAILFIGVLLWILYSAYTARNGQTYLGGGRGPHGGGGGGGGGGGWNPGWGPGGDDPPPPYPGTKPYQSQQQGWRPGFWSGLAGGAAAGYMAGGRNRNDDYQRGGGSGWRSGSSSQGFSAPSSSRHESTGFGSTRRR